MKTCTIDGCDKQLLAQNLCSMHYWRQKRNGNASKKYTSKWEKHGRYKMMLVLKASGCLESRTATGGILGYPRRRWNGKSVSMNRVALEYKLKRPIKPGMLACHSCP